jgi:hypothetical protein
MQVARLDFFKASKLVHELSETISNHSTETIGYFSISELIFLGGANLFSHQFLPLLSQLKSSMGYVFY